MESATPKPKIYAYIDERLMNALEKDSKDAHVRISVFLQTILYASLKEGDRYKINPLTDLYVRERGTHGARSKILRVYDADKNICAMLRAAALREAARKGYDIDAYDTEQEKKTAIARFIKYVITSCLLDTYR